MNPTSNMYIAGDGWLLDDTGCVIQTQYVDVSGQRERQMKFPLRKACNSKYALETSATLKISQPKVFRGQGESLIQDTWEGRAEIRHESHHDNLDTAERVEGERQNCLLQQGAIRRSAKTTQKASERQHEEIDFNGGWWIYCVSEQTEGEDEEAWRATLDPAYDHVSEIYQPRRFTQALALMAAEQIEIERDYSVIRTTVDGGEEMKRRYPVQQVLHGPVLYSDEIYESISRQPPNAQMLYRAIFTKRQEYAAQREYRFAIFGRGNSNLSTIYLEISPRLREALEPPRKLFAPRTLCDESNKTKPSSPAEKLSEPEKLDTRPMQSNKVRESHRSKAGSTKRSESRWITRDGEGHILKAEIEVLSSRVARYVTRCSEADVESIPITHLEGAPDTELEDARGPLITVWIEKDLRHVKVRWNRDITDTIDSITVEQIDADNPDAGPPFPDAIPFEFDRPKTTKSETQLRSINEEFADQLLDPSFPRSPIPYWTESDAEPAHVAATYGVVEAISMAIEQVPRSERPLAAAAGWHATRCVRNLYAQFGPIVTAVWLEENEIVTLQLDPAPFTRAQCRFWINPDGRYLVSVRNKGIVAEWKGGDEHGTLGFPTGHHVELLRKYGWHPRN